MMRQTMLYDFLRLSGMLERRLKASRWLNLVFLALGTILLSGCTSVQAAGQPSGEVMAAEAASTITTAPPAAAPTSPLMDPTLQSATTQVQSVQEPSQTAPAQVEPDTPAATAPVLIPDTGLSPENWRDWPVVPEMTATSYAVYQQGQQMYKNPRSFTRIGDCQSIPVFFLGTYGKSQYSIPEELEHLNETVKWFSGSFLRESIAAQDGFRPASVFTPLMANREVCQGKEHPLECEFRVSQPAFAFIALGTNWVPSDSTTFEKYLSQIVDYSLSQGVVPILVTKGDNVEQDWSINESIARVAYQRDVPLYNAWRALQPLPNHGLDKQDLHLTGEAWEVRSLGALQTLDSLVRELGLLPAQPEMTDK